MKFIMIMMLLTSLVFASAQHIDELIVDELTIRDTIVNALGEWLFDSGLDVNMEESDVTLTNVDLFTLWSRGADADSSTYFQVSTEASTSYGHSNFVFEVGFDNAGIMDDHWVLMVRDSSAFFASGIIPGMFGENIVDVDFFTQAVNVEQDFTAGTIEADNGVDATNFIFAVGDTITVVGGIITNLAHP